MRRRRASAAAILATALLAAGAAAQAASPASIEPAPAATPAPGQAGAAPAPAPPAVVPLYAVPRAATDALLRLRTLARSDDSGADLGAIRRDLPRLDLTLAGLQEARVREAATGITRRDLLDWRLDWQRASLQVDAWTRSLEGAAQAAQKNLAEVRRMRDVWEATARAAESGAAPTSVRRNVAAVVEAARGAEEDLDARLATRLDLLEQVSARGLTIGTATRDIDALDEADQQRLFALEGTPLWRAFGRARRAALPGAQIVESWEGSARTVREFARDSRRALEWQAVFLVGLIVLMLVFRPRVLRRAAEDPAFAVAGHVLSRPFSAALLVALIATFWFHPSAPAAVYRIAVLLVVVPILRILPGIIDPRLLPHLRVLAVLFCLDRIVGFASPHSLLLRLMLLAVTGAAFLLLLWGLRPGGVAAGGEGRLWRAVYRAAFAALALLAVSVLANLLGNVSLSELLTRATLGAGYFAVALYALALVVESLWEAALSGPAAHRIRVVERHGEMLRRRGVAAARWAAVVLWAIATLGLFGLWRPFLTLLGDLLAGQVTLGDVAFTVGDVALFAATLTVSILLARLLRFLLDETVLPRMPLPRGVPAAVSTTVQYLVVGAGLLLATLASGLQMERFTFLAGALGVGVGFGLQNVVNNFVSGLILLYERPVQRGDWVEVGSLLGEVRRIGIRSSTIRTFEGAEVIVPNGNLISEQVVNWTLSDRLRRIEIQVGVSYGSDPDRVLEVLIGVSRGHASIQPQPQPRAMFLGFGDSSLDFSLRFWTADFDNWQVLASEVRLEILRALRAARIEIPFPQRDLHLRTVDAKAARTLAGPDAAPAE